MALPSTHQLMEPPTRMFQSTGLPTSHNFQLTSLMKPSQLLTTFQLFANQTLQCAKESQIHSICPTSETLMMHWPPLLLSEVLWSLSLSSRHSFLLPVSAFAAASATRCFASQKRSNKPLLLRKLKKLHHPKEVCHKEVWVTPQHQCTTQE